MTAPTARQGPAPSTGGVCESCCRRPAAGRVVLDDAEPFAVCVDCAPTARAFTDFPDVDPPDRRHDRPHHRPQAERDRGRSDATTDPSDTDREPDGEFVPPLDWSGVITIRQPWTEVAQPIAITAALAAVAYGTYWFSGQNTHSFLAMVAVGSVGLVVAGRFDRWLLRGHSIRWGIHRVRR